MSQTESDDPVFRNKKILKDQKSYDKYGAYYLSVKNRAKLKMHSALENSEIEFYII